MKNFQKAKTYALYEIFTSYFKKSHCLTKNNEINFKLEFFDFSVKNQEQFETQCINLIEQKVSKFLDLQKLQNETCNVSFVKNTENICFLVFDCESKLIKVFPCLKKEKGKTVFSFSFTIIEKFK